MWDAQNAALVASACQEAGSSELDDTSGVASAAAAAAALVLHRRRNSYVFGRRDGVEVEAAEGHAMRRAQSRVRCQ